jgi:hypothetical protein
MRRRKGAAGEVECGGKGLGWEKKKENIHG